MFGRSLKLFRIFGFNVRVDISWTFLALLIATSLALGFFPNVYEGWPASTYWWLAIAGVIGHKRFQYDLCGDAVNTADQRIPPFDRPDTSRGPGID